MYHLILFRSDYTPYHSQPINFTRNENDENVFVPCPYGGPAAQTWKIGDQFYSSSTLPENYHPTIGGLIIGSIQSNMSGLTFQCFSPNGTGLYVDESSVGTLSVSRVQDNNNAHTSKELSGNYYPCIAVSCHFLNTVIINLRQVQHYIHRDTADT